MLKSWYTAFLHRVDIKHFPKKPELLWNDAPQELALSEDVIVAEAKAREATKAMEELAQKYKKPTRPKKKKK